MEEREALGFADAPAYSDRRHPGVKADRAVSGRMHRARLVAWACLPILAGVYLAAVLSPLAGSARLVVLEVIYTTPILVTVVLGAIAASRSEGTERRFWVLMSLANAVLAGCEVLLVYWVVAISAAGPPLVSWPFQFLHLIAALCFLGLVVSMTRLQDNAFSTRLRVVLDVGALGVLVYLAALVVYVRPVMAPANPPVSTVLVGAGYALAGVLLLFGTLGNIVGFKFVKWRSWEMMTAIALSLYSIAVAMWPLWSLSVVGTTRNVNRGLLDVVQMCGHYILMMAAVYRLTEPAEWNLRPLPVPQMARSKWVSAVLPVATIAAIPLVGYLAFLSLDDPRWFAVFGVLTVVLVALVIMRSLVLAFEHTTLFQRSVTDPLTGLSNHRFFHDTLEREVGRALRYGEVFGLVLLDLDDFGQFNHAHGHAEGDRLLARIGEKLAGAFAGGECVARIGGDEFAVLMPGADSRSATIATQHIVDLIAIEGGPRPGMVSVSAGIAEFPGDASDASELLRLADGALFHAKATGKGRVVLFEAGRVPDLNARERIERLERQSRLAAVRALAAAVDARDAATRDHSQRVAELAVRLGREIGMSDERVRLLEQAALMHDVGKIGTPDAVLNKAEPLTEDEWREIRQHCERGQNILASTELVEVVPWVRSHHERWDGSGYPDGLVAEEIPREARILAVCDAYEAMTSLRAYQDARTFADALAELRAGSGTQFDPFLADALVCMLMAEAAAEAAEMPADTTEPRVAPKADPRASEAASSAEGWAAPDVTPEQA